MRRLDYIILILAWSTCSVAIRAQVVRDTFVSYDILTSESAFELVYVLSTNDYREWLMSDALNKKRILKKYLNRRFEILTSDGLSKSTYSCKKFEVGNSKYDFEPFLNIEYVFLRENLLGFKPKDFIYKFECDDEMHNFEIRAELFFLKKRLFETQVGDSEHWSKKFRKKIQKATHVVFKIFDESEHPVATFRFYIGFPSDNKIVQMN